MISSRKLQKEMKNPGHECPADGKDRVKHNKFYPPILFSTMLSLVSGLVIGLS